MFADQAIAFNRNIQTCLETHPLSLPEKHRLMNPFAEGQAMALSEAFYRRFYQDDQPRRLILGINPGRHGAGLTGIPFTDSLRLERLGMDTLGLKTHEPSAVFMEAMMNAYGGAQRFYQEFYINSPLPLGLLHQNAKGNWVNANYYDHKGLVESTLPFIEHTMQQYQSMSIQWDVVYCLGQGKNAAFLNKLNQQKHYFKRLVPLAHPRYVVQYKHKQMSDYIQRFMNAFSQ